MKVLEYAMQMELDGMTYYDKSADQVSQPEVKKILKTLAEEERRHYNLFKRMQTSSVREAERELDASPSAMATTKNIFQEMVEQKKYATFANEARQIWQHALKLEEKSEKLYRDEAAKESDSTRRFLLERLADEEKNHVYLIDNMLSFMADPQGFTDSATFKNFRSWEGR